MLVFTYFMIKKISPFLHFCLLLIFFGCNNNEISKTYFGGQIINPKTNHVILFERETAIDTFYLSDNNRFFAEFDSKKEGLYYFKHDNEFQYIYLEPKDSLQIRLNTLNFDESLVFSGKGAERNNFLIDCFIDSEKENKNFYDYYSLKPTQFLKIIDSLETVKIKKYNDFSSRNDNETEECMTFLNIALTYPLYSKIENYPLNHARILRNDSFPKTNENFYKHREKVNLNKESLIYFGVYSNFITNLLYNKTYASGFEPSVRDYSPEFTKTLLEITNTNIEAETTKNILLKQEVKYHFFKNSESTIDQEVFDTYFSLNTNKDFETQIKNLVSDTKYNNINSLITDFTVFDYTNIAHNIKDIIDKKNTVIYFWNPKHISEDFISSKVNYLSSKNENVQFIGVKIDGNNESHIEKLDIKNQYFINSTSDANVFLSSKLPRVILLDKTGRITNGYASISSKKIYYQVKELNKN